MTADAIVIGAGPNGLVAANLLADRGWSVTVLEEQDAPGGAVKSAEVVEPGFVTDLFSAFYPLSAASRVIRGLELERHGLRWRRSDVVVAHPLRDGSCALLSMDLDETCASLDAYAPGDGDGWRRLYALWERVGPHIVDALVTPFPPVRPGLAMLAKLNTDLVEFARFGLLPVRRLAEETFEGAGGANLLAGNALHADLTPDSSGGGLFGWLLCGVGQMHGFPVPEGGAGKMVEALVARLRERGGEVHCSRLVTEVLVRDGTAVGVRTRDGEAIEARRAVLADTTAPALFGRLLPEEHRKKLPAFQFDSSTVKVDWALDAPIPWTAAGAGRAGTVHVSEGMDHLTRVASDLVTGRIPEEPFLVLGQYSECDPTRMPAGKESAWAYTHVPQGVWEDSMTDEFVGRMEEQVERLAPGFTKSIRGRHVQTPTDLERNNRNLEGGAINAGTAQLYQQLVFRPSPDALARPETHVQNLYLASASAHPGGGVHGGPGSNAARAALAHHRLNAPKRLLQARGRALRRGL